MLGRITVNHDYEMSLGVWGDWGSRMDVLCISYKGWELSTKGKHLQMRLEKQGPQCFERLICPTIL